MGRKPQPWFRFYTEALHDPKLRELPCTHRWVWVAVLGAARQSPIPGILLMSEHRPLSERALADLAAVTVRDVQKALVCFSNVDMIHRDEATEAWCVTNWASRQFESDDVTLRTRKHRAREPQWNVPSQFQGTAPETETETETESSSSSSDPRASSQAVDNHAQNGQGVPNETWDAYAELKMRRQADVKNPVPWKRSTAINARTELGDLAALWWAEFDLTPRRLAECLMDGQVRNVARRVTT